MIFRFDSFRVPYCFCNDQRKKNQLSNSTYAVICSIECSFIFRLSYLFHHRTIFIFFVLKETENPIHTGLLLRSTAFGIQNFSARFCLTILSTKLVSNTKNFPKRTNARFARDSFICDQKLLFVTGNARK